MGKRHHNAAWERKQGLDAPRTNTWKDERRQAEIQTMLDKRSGVPDNHQTLVIDSWPDLSAIRPESFRAWREHGPARISNIDTSVDEQTKVTITQSARQTGKSVIWAVIDDWYKNLKGSIENPCSEIHATPVQEDSREVIERLQGRIANLERTKTIMEREFDHVRSDVFALRDRNRHLETKLWEIGQNLLDTTERADTLLSENQRLRRKVEELELMNLEDCGAW